MLTAVMDQASFLLFKSKSNNSIKKDSLLLPTLKWRKFTTKIAEGSNAIKNVFPNKPINVATAECTEEHQN